jgi:hypothetical protein
MTLQELSLVHLRVSVAQAFGGENDQRESSCDHRAVRRGLQIRPNRLERGPRARSLKGAMR